MVRVQQVSLHGVRIACNRELHDILRAALQSVRGSKTSWTAEEWAIAADTVKCAREWSSCSHGGLRRPLAAVVGAKTTSGTKALPAKAKASAAKPATAKVKARAAKTKRQQRVSTAKAGVDEVVQARSPAPPLLATCDKENTDTLMAGDEAVVSVLDDKVHRWPPAAVEVASGVGVHSFAVLHFIAKGSYGRVYKALHNDTGTHVAIKVVELDGHLASFQERELALLKKLCGHPNIVCLHHTTFGMFTLELVLEYCDTTLHDFIKQRRFVSGMRVAFTRQLFAGLRFVHSHRIVHRDIKPANVLIARGCAAASPAQFCLKIADFGLARTLPADGDGDDDPAGVHLSGGVFTRYYRPIEVLMGSRSYGTAADVWAAGCSCGEMCRGEPIFPGKSSSDMIVLILKEVGMPSVSRWPALAAMPRFEEVVKVARLWESMPPRRRFVVLRQCGSAIGDKYFGLLRATLEPVPSVRLTASEACSADLE